MIIDPSGIALTNHHVIIGAGVSGLGGLADGKLYHWKLIGTDPGGDVSVIQMEPLEPGTPFPFAPLGNSDDVAVGDWALAMGNPFVLTEDQKPTVTLGIVSGVKRYQPGAGQNQLVYGNCIQVDSSINPGNSGGPLFNMRGEVIGINGRGSFQDRGRVNVGLGYAISANQILNFLPELLATKLVEHGTLDANFTDRGGKVLCSNLYDDTYLYQQGIRPGDELLEFEGQRVHSANQFTNLICTLPEDWPAHLRVRKSNGEVKSLHMRLFGLPYAVPKKQPQVPGKEPTPEQKQQMDQRNQLVDLLSAKPGTIRDVQANQHYAMHLLKSFAQQRRSKRNGHADHLKHPTYHWTATIEDSKANVIGDQDVYLYSKPIGFTVRQTLQDQEVRYGCFGGAFFIEESGRWEKLPVEDASQMPAILIAAGIQAMNQPRVFEPFGELSLHGSDKIQHQTSCRFRRSYNGEELYFWYSLSVDQRGLEGELLQVATSMDRDQDLGGVNFVNWENEAGRFVPARCQVVKGLSETPILSFEKIKAEWVDQQAPTHFFESPSKAEK